MMEPDMREKAKNAMRLILEAARFDVEEVDDPLDLSAVREGVCLLVLCSNEKDMISQFDKTNYSLMIDDHEMTCKKLLFSIDKDISTENCIQWGVDEFVRYTGEAVLADILNRELALDLTPSKGRRPQVAAPASPAAAAPEPSGISIPHFPIKLTEQAAIRAAGVQGTAKLRFMPYYLFHYTSTGRAGIQGPPHPVRCRRLECINAINGIKIDLDGKQIEDTDIPGGAEVCNPHIKKDEATERMVNELIDRLTQKVRIKQEKGDAIFYEEKILKPDRKNITVDTQQVYIPVWQIRGKKIVEVNAFTGELLSEPMDEGVEVF